MSQAKQHCPVATAPQHFPTKIPLQGPQGTTTYTAACFNTLGSRVGLCCTSLDSSTKGGSKAGFSIFQLPMPSLSHMGSSVPNSSFSTNRSGVSNSSKKETGSSSNTAIAASPSSSLLVQPVLPTETKLGGVKLLALLHTVPLVFVVPSATDRVLQLFDLKTSTVLSEVQFDSTILNLHVNTKRLVVVAERTMHLFDWTKEGMPCLTQTNPIQTFHPSNKLGLASLSEVHPETGSCYLAFPQSSATTSTAGTTSAVTGSSKGEVFLVDAINVHQLGSLQAHSGLVQALRFTPNGSMLATASEKGTIIRIFATPSKDLLYTFRRGIRQTTIYDLRFSLDMQLLSATGASGRVHIFKLGFSGGSFTSRLAQGFGSFAASAVTSVTGTYSTTDDSRNGTVRGGDSTDDDGEDATTTATNIGGESTISTSSLKLDLPAGTIHAQCLIDAGHTSITVLSLVSARKKKRGPSAVPEPTDGATGDLVTPLVSTYRLRRDFRADLVKQYPLVPISSSD